MSCEPYNGLLPFRLLIAILAGQIAGPILFLSSIVAPSIGRKWCLKDWMEELARILSGNKKQLSNSRAVEVCTLNSRLSAWLELLKILVLR
jgi:hypothetical protein